MILAAGDVRTASLTMIEASPPSAPLRSQARRNRSLCPAKTAAAPLACGRAGNTAHFIIATLTPLPTTYRPSVPSSSGGR
jgi:hypothetical protein